jgi:aspartyl-tRNA(Asn)/glutamyl-tRNA(Gln) amidotransferase subunit B
LPEPDLPPLDLTRAGLLNLEELKLSIPELPEEKRQRFAREFGALDQKQIEILIEERRLAQIFEETISELIAEEGEETISKERKNELTRLVFNYLTSDIKGMLNEEGTAVENLKITPENLADLIFLVGEGEISSRIAKDLLKEMFRSGLDPRAIMAEKKISQVSDKEAVAEAVEAVLADNPRALSDYKKGKENALQFLIGQAMAKLKGQGNPDVIAEVLKEKLKWF